MFQALSRTLSAAGFHHDLRGLWEAPSAVGGFGEGQRAQSAQLRVTGKREEPGRWAGRHHGDFLPGTVSQGKLSCTLFGWAPAPSFSWLEEEDAVGRSVLWDALWLGIQEG